MDKFPLARGGNKGVQAEEMASRGVKETCVELNDTGNCGYGD